jgi:hypothetical protein
MNTKLGRHIDYLVYIFVLSFQKFSLSESRDNYRTSVPTPQNRKLKGTIYAYSTLGGQALLIPSGSYLRYVHVVCVCK